MSFASLMARLSDLFGVGANSVPFANRNLFVDGAFDYWIAASAPATGYSTATMWYFNQGTGGTATASQQDARAVAGLDSQHRWYAQHAQTVASTGTVAAATAPYIMQRVEGVYIPAAKSVTLSFKLWVASGSITIPAIRCAQSTGSGGTALPSSDKAVNWVVTTTPKRFSVRLDIPALASGLTYAAGDFTQFGLWLPPGVTFTLNVAEAQLEFCNPNSSSDLNGNGGAPTCFEYRGIQAESARIQRYWQYVPAPFISMYAPGSGWAIGQTVTYPVPMRGVPAIAVNAAGTLSNASAGPLAAQTTSNGTGVYVTSNAATVCGVNGASLVADARL